MPKLTDSTIAQRVDQARCALQTWILSEPPITIDEACEKNGLSTSQYYHWLRSDPEAVQEMKKYLAESSRMELALLSSVTEMVTASLVQDALSPATKPTERLAIKRYIDKRLEDLEGITQIVANDGAAAYLSGVDLEPAVSRLTIEVGRGTSVKVTVDSKDIVDGSIVEESHDPEPSPRLLAQVDPDEMFRRANP